MASILRISISSLIAGVSAFGRAFGLHQSTLLPWLTVVVSLLGGAFGLYQYWESNRASRAIEVIRLYHDFVGLSPANKSLQSVQNEIIGSLGSGIDKIYCEFVVSRRITLPEGSDLQCDDPDSYARAKEVGLNDEQKAELRRKFNLDYRKILDEHKVMIERLLGHYIAVIACVENGGCDSRASIRIYESHMLDFVNAFCPYFEQQGEEWNDRPADTRIVEYLLRYRSYKNGGQVEEGEGQSRFRCDGHRKLESRP